MKKLSNRTRFFLAGLLLAAALVSIAATGQPPTGISLPGQMDPTATPVPGMVETPAAAPVVVSGATDTTQAQPQAVPTMTTGMGCPMMNGGMGGMNSMNGMNGMSGMSGMSGMGTMQGMNGMSGMGNMTGMSGMGSMSNMGSMQGMTNNPLYFQDELQAASFWELNPWWMVGWLVLLVMVVAVLAGIITWVVWFVNRARQPRVIQPGPEA